MAGGVKGLVESGISILPSAYIFDKQGRGDDFVDEGDCAVLPLVDLSADRTSVVQQIHRACKEWGMFQLVGHGVPRALMDDISRLAQSFFDLPLEQRMQSYSEDKAKPVRFSTSFNPDLDVPQLWYDYIFHICNPLFSADDVPSGVARYWEVASEYVKRTRLLAQTLLGMLSEALGVGSELEKLVMADPWHVMRMNYYPPCPAPELAVGIGKHTDHGALTIVQLDKEVPGLQIVRDGRWMTVKPIPGALTINIGDLMEILTNGRYKSVLHRAIVNGQQSRISIATFISPNIKSDVAPIVAPEDERHYAVCKVEEYLHLFYSNVFTAKPAISFVQQQAM